MKLRTCAHAHAAHREWKDRKVQNRKAWKQDHMPTQVHGGSSRQNRPYSTFTQGMVAKQWVGDSSAATSAVMHQWLFLLQALLAVVHAG